MNPEESPDTVEETQTSGPKVDKQKDTLMHLDDGTTVDYAKDPDTQFAADLPEDAEGYKPITWNQLKHVFCYERPAHKFKLTGDISQRDRENWERSRQIKIRDSEGVEGAVFFYDDPTLADLPYREEDLAVGNRITIRSPRYHRFMDGQEGMRVEESRSVACVKKEKFTDASRIDYGTLNKNNGNKKFEAGKFEDAMQCYDAAINYLEGTFHETPQQEQAAKELAAQCYLNIAACHRAQKQHQFVEIPCQKALKVNASPVLNAKAYFRIGQAAIDRQEYVAAETALKHACDLMPEDPRIQQELDRLRKEKALQREAEKTLFKTPIEEQQKKPFGLRRRLLSAPPTQLDGVCNFRDAGGKMCGKGLRMKRFFIYRSANLSAVTKSALALIKEDLGLKTVVDLRAPTEVSHAAKRAAKAAKRTGVPVADIRAEFPVVRVECPPPSATRVAKMHFPGKGWTEESLSSRRVTFQIDAASRSLKGMISWWLWLIIAFLQIFFLGHWLMMRLLVRKTKSIGVVGFYQLLLRVQGPEIREVFEILSEKSNYPMIVCCSLGKDRTGLTIALLQSVCGVADEEIIKDYTRTTAGLSEELKKMQRDEGLPEEFNVAQPQFMASVLLHLRQQYGGVEGYLASIGVSSETLEKIRAALTEPVPQDA